MIDKTFHEDGKTYYFRQLEDWYEMIRLAERVNREAKNNVFGGLRCASLERSDSRTKWSGTESLSEAIRLSREGWPEGREMIRNIRENISVEKLLPRSNRLTRTVDLSGDEPDIDLYLQGDPEHMATLWDRIELAYGKVVRIAMSRSASASTDPERIVHRGVAVLSAVEIMILLGFTVEIDLIDSTKRSDYFIEYQTPILHAGDPLHLDTLAFMLIHPSVLRRIWFAVAENEPLKIRKQFGFEEDDGYGAPQDPHFRDGYDLVVDWKDGLLESEEEIVPYTLKVLEKIGIKVPSPDSLKAM